MTLKTWKRETQKIRFDIHRKTQFVGAVMVDIVWKLDLQLPMQSVPISTKVVSSNPTHGQVYSIQHYLISLSMTCHRLVVFSDTTVSSTNKTDRHNITEILLKVVLNTITPNPQFALSFRWHCSDQSMILNKYLFYVNRFSITFKTCSINSLILQLFQQ